VKGIEIGILLAEVEISLLMENVSEPVPGEFRRQLCTEISLHPSIIIDKH
jgi:hypothetical protein